MLEMAGGHGIVRQFFYFTYLFFRRRMFHTSFLDDLPDPVWILLLKYLTPADRKSLRLTNTW